jgi:hypothetical protein
MVAGWKRTQERGPKGDHGQVGDQGVRGLQGERGLSFSKMQVLVMFLFVVGAFAFIANNAHKNSDRIDRLEQQVTCLQTPTACEVNLRP